MSLLIIKEFIRNPCMVGALWPSSSGLCREMVSGIEIKKAKAVVELGPGTGVITRHILRELSPQAKFFAIELNREIYEKLRMRMPDVMIFNDSAANLRGILKQQNLDNADVVISGLPWASFPDAAQEEIIGEVSDCLAADGYFTTFAYLQGLLLPGAKKFRQRLKAAFPKVETSRIVFRNLPPAFVYRCRK